MTTLQHDRPGSRASGIVQRRPLARATATPLQWPRVKLIVIWLLVVLALVAWRNGDYFSGGFDSVVVAKAVLSVGALVLAARQALTRDVGARSLCLVGTYVAVATLGGWARGSLFSSVVLSMRVVLVAAIVLLVLMAYPAVEAAKTLFAAMATVGLVSAAAGIGTFLSGGRLHGGILPLNSNQLALLFGPAALGLVWRLLHGKRRGHDVPLLVLLVGLTWLTGSRTGLAALALATLLIVARARRLPVAGFLTLVAAVPALVYVIVSTSAVTKYFGRGGTSNVSSLNSRTIAWQAAFTTPTGFWQHWLGGGFAEQTIAVTGTYWNQQVLDSSWVSAYVQAGILGITLLGLWSVVTLVTAFRTPKPLRSLWAALVLYTLISSVLMSGLIDSQILFVVMFLAAVASERASRTTPPIAGCGASAWRIRANIGTPSGCASLATPLVSVSTQHDEMRR